VDEHWIPCLTSNGEVEHLSLKRVFLDAERLIDIVDPSPLVKASLFRLILAIHLRAIGAMNTDIKTEMWERRDLGAHKVIEYLEKWSRRFDMLDADRPFYQVPGFDIGTPHPVHKLALERSAGNNKILFDHRMDDEPELVSLAEAARMLVTVQSYSLGGGRSATVNLTHSPLIGKALVIIKGANILETILLNSVDYDPKYPMRPLSNERPSEDIDKPHWEVEELETPGGARRPNGYLDYLTWQSRAVRLVNEPDGIRQIHFAQGTQLVMEDGTCDPMVPYRRDKDGVWRAVGVDADKEPWRGLSSLLQLQTDVGRPPKTVDDATQLLLEGIIGEGLDSNLTVIGLVNNQANVSIWRESTMPLPPRYLRDRQTVVWIERALSMAENRASALSETLWIYASQILSPSSGNADTGAVRNLISSLDGLRRYWVEVERPFYELIANMAGSTEPYPTKELKEWGSALSRMADRALDSTLDSGESNARTLKAGSRARSVFKMKMRKIRQKEDCSYE
jgi:CRISPR system Cascade subunit CasA